MRRRTLVVLMTLAVSLVVAASGAQALVVNDQGTAAGVALVPGTRASLATAGISAVTSSGPCLDPWLSSDLGGPTLPNDGLCWHGGAVIHAYETFDLAWDPLRRDWATTRDYVEQFLRDVADGSGTLTSPYAVTTQYHDRSGRAGNASLYGGGCIDYGSTGGSSCRFGSGNATATGNSYPANGCPVTGTNQFHMDLSGAIDSAPNDVCLTDAQIKGELTAMVSQEGLVGHIQPGYTPLLVVMTPPGVVTCLDAAGALCSANGTFAPPVPDVSTAASGGKVTAGTYKVAVSYVTPSGETVASASQTVTTTGTTSTITIASPPSVSGAKGWYAYVTGAGGTTYTRQQAAGSPTAIGTDLTLSAPPTGTGAAPPLLSTSAFCSYHSQVMVGGTEFAYVVQPWTALADLRGCDEPDAPQIPQDPSDQVLAIDVGARLVGPLSQGQIAAIVNPGLNGWSALNGSETNDNGCVPFANGLDKAIVGTSSQNPYLLQREFNNAGVIESDPNAPACVSNVALAPTFVVPSAVEHGDVVEFDGSKTVSTLIVPGADYYWNFGDGATAFGPSVEHSYADGGAYTVKLTVMDRGGNVASVSQTIEVLGPGKPVPSSKPPPTGHASGGLHAHLVLMPQALRSALRSGVSMQVSANEAADGIATLSISRATARRAHLRYGRGATVVIGRGTVSGITAGDVKLHLRLPHGVATKLAHLGHVTLNVRLALVAASGDHIAVDAAGRY